MNATTSEAVAKRQPSRELTRILNECRDMAIARLTASFAQILDRVGDTLMDRASKTDVRDEQQMFLDARGTLKSERPALMAEFERQLTKLIDERVAGRTDGKQDFHKAADCHQPDARRDAVDGRGGARRQHHARGGEPLPRRARHAQSRRGLPDGQARPRHRRQSARPAIIVGAFSKAVETLKTDRRTKFQIMKDLNQAPLGDINAIYAHLNQHLTGST